MYAACVIWYFSYYFLDNIEDEDYEISDWKEMFVKIMIYILNLYIAGFEVIQMFDLKFAYFSDLTNWVDMVSISLILFIMTSNDFFGGKTLWKEW